MKLKTKTFGRVENSGGQTLSLPREDNEQSSIFSNSRISQNKRNSLPPLGLNK